MSEEINKSSKQSSAQDKKNQQAKQISQAAFKNGVILGLFALVSTGLIAITHFITKDKIASEVELATARRLSQIIPADSYDNEPYHDCALVKDKNLSADDSAQKVFRLRNKGKNFALIQTSVAPDGYAGRIKLLVGVYKDGKIAGVRVSEHQETPGLGDKIEIEKSNWINQFDGRSIADNPPETWQVRKDGGEFDALTGATITPRAIISAVYRTLEYYQENGQAVFKLASNCGDSQ